MCKKCPLQEESLRMTAGLLQIRIGRLRRALDSDDDDAGVDAVVYTAARLERTDLEQGSRSSKDVTTQSDWTDLDWNGLVMRAPRRERWSVY